MASADQSRLRDIQDAIANVPPGLRRQVASDAIKSQRKVIAFPYYSTTRFQTTGAGGGGVAYPISATDRTCFNYRVGDAITSAGFDATYGSATDAETNVLVASQTRNNEDVYIWGIAAMLSPDSDAQLAQLVFRNTIVKIGFAADDSFTLGRMDFLPGGGGLFGAGTAYLQLPGQADTWQTRWSQMSNGTPGRDNYYRLPQPLVWRGTGTGKDTSLTLTTTVRRAITFTPAANRAGVAGGAGTQGTAAWTPPTPPNTVGTFVDVTFRLICVSVGKRSENA